MLFFTLIFFATMMFYASPMQTNFYKILNIFPHLTGDPITHICSNFMQPELSYEPLSAKPGLKSLDFNILGKHQGLSCIDAYSKNDCNFAVSGSCDGSIKIWGCGGVFFCRAFIQKAHEGAVLGVQICKFVQDGLPLIMSYGADDTIKVWSLNGECLQAHKGEVVDASWISENSILILLKKTIHLWRITERGFLVENLDFEASAITIISDQTFMCISTYPLKTGNCNQILFLDNNQLTKKTYQTPFSYIKPVIRSLYGERYLVFADSHDLCLIDSDVITTFQCASQKKIFISMLGEDSIVMMNSNGRAKIYNYIKKGYVARYNLFDFPGKDVLCLSTLGNNRILFGDEQGTLYIADF